MRQGRVVQPEGSRGTLLTEWRPDRLHRPHSPCLGNHYFFLYTHPSILPLQPPRRRPALPSLNLHPCHLHPPTPPPCCHLAFSLSHQSDVPPRPTLPQPFASFSRLPLATRHSQMSAGSCITETARLSAVVTWHLKAVRAWDTVASHSTLIAVY